MLRGGGPSSQVRIHAPAKVNLFLRVLAREESGYHQIETLFAGLELGDTLSLALRGPGVSLRVEGADLGAPEQNLAYRAADGFLAMAGSGVGVEIRLTKRIPAEAGLGGGSSDAAAVLKALAYLLPDRVSRAGLLGLAGEIGADVAFFLSPTPLALAWGRGDRILALPPLPRRPVILALPPKGMRTPEAYRLLAEGRRERGERGAAGVRDLPSVRSWDAVSPDAENEFESVVFERIPELGLLRDALVAEGAEPCLLSGSGSAVFGVLRGEGEARAAMSHLEADFPETRFMLTHSLSRMPDPIPVPGVEG